MRSARVILGVSLIVLGLVLSFVFPIMSIVPNMVIEYPPSQTQGDGATFPDDKYLYQEFTSDIELTWNSATDRLWIGMWRDEGIEIPQGYGIVGRLSNMGTEKQDGDFSYACFNVDIDQIPTDNPGYVKVRWIDDADYPHSAVCEYRRPYGHSPAFLKLEVGKPYRISMWPVDASVTPQIREIPLPSVFWQFTTIGNPGDSGEASGAVRTYYDTDFSFAVSSGQYEEVETNGGAPIDDTPPIDDAPVSVGAIFVGAILFAFGIVILIDESGFFNQFAGQFVYIYVYIALAVIWILAFTIVFYLSNNQTFWWEWIL